MKQYGINTDKLEEEMSSEEYDMIKDLPPGLHPIIKEKLVEDAVEIDEEMKKILRDSYGPMKKKVKKTALFLACDKNSCATNVKPSLTPKYIKKIRKETGIERIFDPSERVDAAVEIMSLYFSDKNMGKLNKFLERKDRILRGAKNITKEVYNQKGSQLGNNKSVAAAGLYIAANLDYPSVRSRLATQGDIGRAIGLSQATIRNNCKMLLETLTDGKVKSLNEISKLEKEEYKSLVNHVYGDENI